MKTALDFADDERLPQDPFVAHISNTGQAYAVRESLLHKVNEAELNLMQVGGQTSASVVDLTTSPNSGVYSSGYSTVSYENRPCAVCKARGKRKAWEYDEERQKLVKAGWKDCDACLGKGWSVVTVTGYQTWPYQWTYTETPNTPYVQPLSPTVAPSGVPFYGSTTAAPPLNN